MTIVATFDEIADDGRGIVQTPVSEYRWRIPDQIEVVSAGGLDQLRWRLRGDNPNWFSPPHLFVGDQVGTDVWERTTAIQRFVNLWKQPREAFADFARRYGVLALCHEHEFPGSHWMPMPPSMGIILVGGGCPPQYANGWYFEPLYRWYVISHEAHCLLQAAMSLGRDRLPEPAVIHGLGWGTELAAIHTSVAGHPDADRIVRNEALGKLAASVSHWLDWGNVRQRLVVHRDLTLRPSLQVGGLFGALAIHLQAMVSGTRRWAFCSGCQRLHFRNRRPVEGDNVWCEDCSPPESSLTATSQPRKQAAMNAAAAAYRRRKKEGGVGRGRTLPCATCGSSFVAKSHRNRFCRPECRRAADRRGWKRFGAS